MDKQIRVDSEVKLANDFGNNGGGTFGRVIKLENDQATIVYADGHEEVHPTFMLITRESDSVEHPGWDGTIKQNRWKGGLQ